MKKMFFILCPVLFVLIIWGTSGANEYVIGDEDMLQLSVWGNPELSVQVPVRPDGMISFPLAGDVRASGTTPQALKTVLEKELSKFIKNPTVSVIVTAVNSFKVFIIGDNVTVSQAGGSGTAVSGVITLKRNTSLMQLLAQLGSLKGYDLNSAYLLRDGKKMGNNFFGLIVQGDISQDIQLKPNDVLFLPDNFDKRIMVVGAVKNPMVIQYREGLTTLDVILTAGGFTEYARQNDVLIVRKAGKETINIEAHIKDVMKDGDISKDVPLMPGDLIVVKTGMF